MARRLPPGLTIDPSTGVISGLPRTAGQYSFTVQAKDSTGAIARSPQTVTIFGLITDGGEGSINGGAPDGTVNVLYSYTGYSATGGTPPYSWSVISGSIPDGLTLSSSGVLAGVPTLVGVFNYRLRASDINGLIGELDDEVEIFEADPFFSAVDVLIHFDVEGVGVPFVDVKGNVFTRDPLTNGLSNLVTPGRFGKAMHGYFPSPDNFSASLTGPTESKWTFECFISINPSGGGISGIFFNVGSIVLRYDGSNVVAQAGGPSTNVIIPGTSINDAEEQYPNKWFHVAICAEDGDAYVFVDGVETGQSWGTAGNIGTMTLEIGTILHYIDEFRMTRGVCRYTSNFTPPDRAFPDG
jgi:hypothetical protein